MNTAQCMIFVVNAVMAKFSIAPILHLPSRSLNQQFQFINQPNPILLLFTYYAFQFQPDDLFSAKIQSLCPSLNGNVCCSEQQFETLRAQVQQASCYPSINLVICFTAFLVL